MSASCVVVPGLESWIEERAERFSGLGWASLGVREREHIPTLARLTQVKREFLAPTSPLTPEEHSTDEGQERAALESLQAA